ncbi:hypothetical protein PtA15_8A43 [Puccinia triticina]|uniref:Uncharacterized protein n=1 Tax=Puccinia triticina TaxID=208348 RepID=A0ABY7CRP4_9BASI|nr:uncharacterized protein PtA15_8A43 [Puccinia triticina]WAQ87142.1 hypothetical protein PtA15_8A43 [Puccinia triticina]WAR57002.1 hypothetical protein PtB15_8B46 [Puccinia triticina]
MAANNVGPAAQAAAGMPARGEQKKIYLSAQLLTCAPRPQASVDAPELAVSELVNEGEDPLQATGLIRAGVRVVRDIAEPHRPWGPTDASRRPMWLCNIPDDANTRLGLARRLESSLRAIERPDQACSLEWVLHFIDQLRHGEFRGIDARLRLLKKTLRSQTFHPN